MKKKKHDSAVQSLSSSVLVVAGNPASVEASISCGKTKEGAEFVLAFLPIFPE